MRNIEAETPARLARWIAIGSPTTTTGVLLMKADTTAVASIITSNKPRGPRPLTSSMAVRARVSAPVRSSALLSTNMAATVMGAGLAKTPSSLAASGKVFSKGSWDSSSRTAKTERPVRSVGQRPRTNCTRANTTSARTVTLSHVMTAARHDRRCGGWPVGNSPAVCPCGGDDHRGRCAA